MASTLPPAVASYVDYLRNAYMREHHRSAASSWLQDRPGGGTKQVKLALIESENEVTYAKMDRFTKSTLHGAEEDIMKPKKTLQLSQLGASESGCRPRLILVEAGHGQGKSHLARLLARMWKEGSLFTDHTLFLLLSLDDPLLQNAGTIADFICHPDSATNNAVAEWMDNENGHHCFLLFDNYEGCLDSGAQGSSIYADIVSGKTLQHATVMVTCQRVPSDLRALLQDGTQTFQHVEVVGFTEAEVTSYASSVFQHDELVTQGFTSYLQRSPAISSLVHIPLYCAAVLRLYSKWDGATPRPFTLTDLHDCLVFECVAESLGSQAQVLPLPGADSDKVRRLPQSAQDLLDQLSQLAYEGLEHGHSVYRDMADDLLQLGLMEAVPTLYSDDHPYRFSHKQLQHYLAAHHILRMTPLHKRKEAICNAFSRKMSTPLPRYIVGRSRWEYPRASFSWLTRPAFDLESVCSAVADNLEALHYIFEAQLSPTELKKIVSKLDNATLKSKPLSLLDCYVISYCIVNSGLIWYKLGCHTCRIDERGVAMMDRARDTSGLKTCFSQIVVLNLSQNPITDSGLESIVSALKSGHMLEELHLENCHITSKGAGCLADLLRTDHTLKVLNLSHNPIGNAGAIQLATALSALSYLKLCGCGLGEEGVAALTSSLGITSSSTGSNPLEKRGTSCIVDLDKCTT